MTPASVHLSCRKQSWVEEDGEEQIFSGCQGREKWLQETYWEERRRMGVRKVWGVQSSIKSWASSAAYYWSGMKFTVSPTTERAFLTLQRLSIQHKTWPPSQDVLPLLQAQASGTSLCSLSFPAFQGKQHLLIPAWAPLNTLVWRCKDTPLKKNNNKPHLPLKYGSAGNTQTSIAKIGTFLVFSSSREQHVGLKEFNKQESSGKNLSFLRADHINFQQVSGSPARALEFCVLRNC